MLREKKRTLTQRLVAFVAPKRKPVAAKRITAWFLLGCCLLYTGFLNLSMTVLAAPEVATPSYVVMEASTGQVICEQDADTRRSPASITKIMTLLIIFEHLKSGRIRLEDEVITSAYAKSMG